MAEGVRDRGAGSEAEIEKGVRTSSSTIRAVRRSITPAPIMSPHVLAIVQAAYRAGWEDRAEVEHAIRRGEIEPPIEGRVDPPSAARAACPVCRVPIPRPKR